MTGIGFLLLTAWVLCAIFAIISIRDYLSPDKIFLVILLVFFGDVFISDFDSVIYILYFVFIAITALSIQFASVNRVLPLKSGFSTRITFSHSLHIILWIFSLPAIAGQLYMFSAFGGMEGYINIVAFRVMEFRGYGPVLAVVGSIGPISAIYFALLVSRKDGKTLDIVLFCVHFLVFVAIGLASSSRGALLVNFVLMLIIYHYMVRPIGFVRVATLALSLLVVASVLAIARGGYRIDQGLLTTGLHLSAEENTHSSFTTYGIEPLNLVLSSDIDVLYWGQTYLTLFTNFIPRSIWPDKPDTGGVILTVQYTLDSYLGLSNLSTGILPEAIINFGPYFGVVLGFVFYSLLLRYLFIRYFAIGAYVDSPVTLQILIGYVKHAYLIWFSAGFIIGEFTSTGMKLILAMLTIYALSVVLRGSKYSNVLRA